MSNEKSAEWLRGAVDALDRFGRCGYAKIKEEKIELRILLAAAEKREAGKTCPRCDSPSPALHPAMQFEGEVQPCSDPWHQPESQPPTPTAASVIAAAKAALEYSGRSAVVSADLQQKAWTAIAAW